MRCCVFNFSSFLLVCVVFMGIQTPRRVGEHPHVFEQLYSKCHNRNIAEMFTTCKSIFLDSTVSYLAKYWYNVGSLASCDWRQARFSPFRLNKSRKSCCSFIEVFLFHIKFAGAWTIGSYVCHKMFIINSCYGWKWGDNPVNRAF